MASIYDKALKRKDYSGIIDKEKQTEAANKKADANGKLSLFWKVVSTQYSFHLCTGKSKDKSKDSKVNEAKAGADVGKIVNLMSVDCNRVSYRVLSFVVIGGSNATAPYRSRWYLLQYLPSIAVSIPYYR